jgi:hypothetical protein
MKTLAPDIGNAPASAAIELVLEAERAAREAVAGCERDARGIVDVAHRDAARIDERTTARIAAVRRRVAARIADAVRQCENEGDALHATTQIDPEHDQRIERAVAGVAAELTAEAP